MSDRLSRSNSQSNLPTYGQDKPEEKNTNVGADKKDASDQSNKNASRGNGEKKQAKPQLKSKEAKEGGEPSESHSGSLIDPKSPFGKLFLTRQAGQVRKEADQGEDGLSKDQLPESPRQQQSDKKETSTNNKVPKLSLKNLGNALASLASDRREMAISPRKTKRETHRNTKDSISSSTNTDANETTTTTTTTTTATTANTALGNSAIPRPTTVVTVPLSQPVSPRSHWHPAVQSNQLASAKPTETRATATATTTDIGENTTTKSVADQQKPKPSGAVPISLLTPEAKKVLEQVQAGREITGDQLAELLVCVQSRGYTVPLTPWLTDTILRTGMVVSVPDSKYPNDPNKETKINIIELISTPFVEKNLNTEAMASLRKKLVNMYKEIYMKLPSNLKNLTAKELRKKTNSPKQ